MIILALTGSIAMGKSETAKMFEAEGVPVFDADREVHRLYAADGAGSKIIATRWPEVVKQGAVDREALAAMLVAHPELLAEVESAIHPLVRKAEAAFLHHHRETGTSVVLLDIPLLFEKDLADKADRIIVVSAPREIQQARAMSRPGMTRQKLEYILARQMPDHEKRDRAHFVIDTSHGLDHARKQVHEILASLNN